MGLGVWQHGLGCGEDPRHAPCTRLQNANTEKPDCEPQRVGADVHVFRNLPSYTLKILTYIPTNIPNAQGSSSGSSWEPQCKPQLGGFSASLSESLSLEASVQARLDLCTLTHTLLCPCLRLRRFSVPFGGPPIIPQ